MCKDIKQIEAQDPSQEYFKELYNACKYMIQHMEEFEDFKIYKLLSKDIDLYPQNICLFLHNRFVSQYKLLIGNEYPKTDNDSEEGFDIVPVIDRACLDNPQILSRILAIFHHFTNGISKGLKRTLLSVNVEKSNEMIDYLIRKINTANTDYSSWILLDDAEKKIKSELIKGFFEKYKSEKNDHRMNYRHQIDFFTEELKNGFPAYCAGLGNLTLIFHAWLYIDLCCWSILQFVILGIIRNKHEKNKMESIEKLNDEIIRLIEREKKERKAVQLEGTSEEVMFQIYSYYYEKDKYLHDITVLEDIEKSEMKRKKPAPEYSLIHFVPRRKTITWQEVMELFSEDSGEKKKKSLRSFKDSLLKCYKGIFQFNNIAGRDLKPEPLTLRAFYREIYLDSTLYNRRQSMTIFHDFLETKDMGNADYYFIDEKINAGMFREYENMDEFYAKNRLQKNLYCLVCQILTLLNPSEMIDKFTGAVENISFVIDEIYKVNAFPNEPCMDINEKEKKQLQLEIKKMINDQREHMEEISPNDIKNLMTLCFKFFNLKFSNQEL